MTSPREGLRAAAGILEEDLRKIDAGEVHASPAYRAFLVGAVRGLKQPTTTESGGYPVDSGTSANTEGQEPAQASGLDGGRPQNTGLADQQDTAFDGGRPGTPAAGPSIDGGKP